MPLSALRLFVVANALFVAASASAQPPAPDYLAGGVARIESGDFQFGLMMLNEVVAPESKAGAADVARAHAYRAQAFLGLGRPGDASAAVLLALKANPDLAVTSPPYSAAVVRLFEQARRSAGSVSPEIDAAAAEQAGDHAGAFAAYVRAYQAMPQPPTADDDRRLREKIITLARRLSPPPAIPQDARAHYAKAEQLIEAEAMLGGGGGASLDAAIVALESAIRSAPWWADATLKLATLLQKRQRVDAALINLNLYRLADPDGYTKATAAKADAERPAARAGAVPRMASVYVYWPSQVRATGRPKVYCDGSLVAELQKGSFVALSVPGGSHDIKLNGKSATFAFEPGGRYYVRVSMEGFTRWASFTIRLADPDEGAAEFQNGAIAANDPRRTYAAQCAAPVPKKR
ncbi:MAG: hypothetical protein K2Y23_16850 [Cyanobacteria bacterium]|nr:hypothetical protein [Cyanobacteriota bacterium]